MEPTPGSTLDGDAAVHEVGELAADREPQAGAAEAARRRLVGLRERLEDLVQRGGVHADAGVGHGEPHDRAISLGGLDIRAHDDFAALGEFHGVADEIHEHLTQAQRIAEQSALRAAAAGRR